MKPIPKSVEDFLAHSRIAVVGYSRKQNSPARSVLLKLRNGGHDVFAVNPNTDMAGEEKCFRDVASIPGGVEAAVVMTRPELSADVVQQCVSSGIGYVWLHRSFGAGSVSREAVRECEKNGVRCIAGGCPMMYFAPVDIGHRCMRWILKLQKRVPAG